MEQAADQEPASYDVHAVEQKWRQVWDGLDAFRAGSAPPQASGEEAEKRYALTMFPYPSGDLHMGHAEVMALHDVIARYWWQRGYDVLNPMGWDSFGLPAENAAIRNDEHPATYTYANIDTQYESFRNYAISFDWSRRFNTSDPEYYRWTQWLFLKFRERGLAYRKNSPVNWCPDDQTVLANEQVVEGRCERCGAEVTKRELTQWYFKITDYAQGLLDDMAPLEATWPERVLTAQRNWIGRSEGAHVDFAVAGHPPTGCSRRARTPCSGRRSWWWRPTRRWPASWLAGAAAGAGGLPGGGADGIGHRPAVDRAGEDRRLPGASPRSTRSTARRYRSGRRTTSWPTTAPGRSWPCPARTSATGSSPRSSGCPSSAPCSRRRAGTGRPTPAPDPRSTPPTTRSRWTGWRSRRPRARSSWLESKGTGQGAVNFRLRDWLLSRQRYWGARSRSCTADRGEVAVPEDQLPVVLPELRGADLKPKGVSPLAAAEDWVNIDCPSCGGPARRDSDTMDTFVDSSWYFLRYCSPHETEGPFDNELVREWSPSDIYVGGVEHAVLHLLYARFFTKVLNDMGMVDFVEPFSAQLNQGQVINGAPR